MKNTFKLLFLFASAVFLVNCKKPSDNVGLSINGNVIKNSVSLQFWDPKSPSGVPANIFVKITGKDASKIYEFGGTKTFNVSSTGILTLGLDPFVKPTASAPISFTVEVFAPDYMTLKIPVIIDGSNANQLITATMINIKNPPAGVTVKQTEVTLGADGSTTQDEVIATVPTPGVPESASITIPEGTKFRNAAGNLINANGTNLVVSQIYYSSRTAASLSAFPQNSFVSDSIYDASGNKVSGYFQTAGFTSIEMSLGGQDVKTFTNDVTVEIGIDPTYVNPTTNNPVQAGETVPVYSYEVAANRWKFEKNVTITAPTAGERNVAFATNHLTYYSAAWTGMQCSTPTNVTFTTGLNVSSSFLVDVYAQNGDPRQPIVAGIFVTVNNGQTIAMSDIPTGPVTMKVYPNNVNNSQFDWTIRDAAALAVYQGTACGGNVTLDVSAAVSAFPPIVFNIVGLCPGNVLVYPTVPTYYRKGGTNMPYTLLGTVVGGQFTTTNLQLGQTYDFLWLYKNRELKMTRMVDSSSYTQVKPVVDRFPGDTLVDLFCY